MKITGTDLNFEREPLAAPWGFKGGYLSELWQSIARITTATGVSATGLGVQSVLWSDPVVFTSCSESAGNALMLAITARALAMSLGTEFNCPVEMQDAILPDLLEYGRSITGNPNLRTTFVLNALVAFDNAVWLAYARENAITSFDEMIPDDMAPALSHRNRRVLSVPAIGYGMAIGDIVRLVDSGNYLLKIKIGSDPSKDGDQDKMLAWDMQRLTEIHSAVGHRHGGPDERNPILYYLDANQRYDGLDRISRLIDHLSAIGAMNQTLLLEEPFAEGVDTPVGDLPITVVADESAHTERDAVERMQLGYGAIALKPVAKTLSMTLKIAKEASERQVPCFCADLTVNPVLVEWNKSIAARLAPLPGLSGGALENNGQQNYRDWERLMSYNPRQDASWTRSEHGEFTVDSEFYASGGGIFEPSAHYDSLVGR